MKTPPKLSVTLACRVVGQDRDRLNDDIAAGLFPCAPNTIPGRTRYFNPDDMVALWLYRELLDDGFSRKWAGRIACAVSAQARQHPQSDKIAFVQSYAEDGWQAYPAEHLRPDDQWDQDMVSGPAIRKVTIFNVGRARQLIAMWTEEQLSYHGEE